jgi:hypothetical protein
LKNALNHALRWELIARNPADFVDTPRLERYEINPLTPDEARTFLTALRGERLEAVYSVALAIGLRRGEILGLRWQDIDLELGYMMGSKQQQRWARQTQLVEPKSAKSRRPLRSVRLKIRFGSGTGIRNLNLAVNRSLQPVQKLRSEFIDCRCVSPFATVYRRRCCTNQAVGRPVRRLPDHVQLVKDARVKTVIELARRSQTRRLMRQESTRAPGR